MSSFITCGLIAALVLAFSAAFERLRLRKFLRRACTGRRWKRRFPRASTAEIREFLDVFVTSFGFNPARRLCFSPEDGVMEIYRALYPFPKVMADSMELEIFALKVSGRYGVDVQPTWRERITLGDLFAQARRLPRRTN